jgi:hypothetical protein
MPLSDETAGLEEVAAALGRKPEWLKRRWLKLHREQGFPRKLSTGDVWPRRQVEVWLRSGGVLAPQPVPANQNTGGVDLVAQAAKALLAQYGATQ